jgi:hypothetical protein
MKKVISSEELIAANPYFKGGAKHVPPTHKGMQCGGYALASGMWRNVTISLSEASIHRQDEPPTQHPFTDTLYASWPLKQQYRSALWDLHIDVISVTS